jgi:hypothetical protein
MAVWPARGVRCYAAMSPPEAIVVGLAGALFVGCLRREDLAG